jgi:hypothetical protein
VIVEDENFLTQLDSFWYSAYLPFNSRGGRIFLRRLSHYWPGELVCRIEVLGWVGAILNTIFIHEALLYIDRPIIILFAVAEPESRKLSEEDSVMKDNVCRAIVRSIFVYNTYHLHPLILSYNQQTEIIFDNSTRNIPSNMTSSYERREILINENFLTQEFVFSCLSVNYKTRNIEELFISREFSANDGLPRDLQGNDESRPKTHHCRFICKENEQKKLVPIALAELPVQVSSNKMFVMSGPDEFKFVEALAKISESRAVAGAFFFLNWCHYHSDFTIVFSFITDDARSKRICNLSEALKFRLCSIILNAEKYRRTVKFPAPSKNSHKPQCEKRELDFQYRTGWRDEVWRTSFPEWGVKCEAVQSGNRVLGMPAIYFISLGRPKEPHQFFVSEEGHSVEFSDQCYI